MADGLIRHIDNLVGIRVRFAAVHDASDSIAYDDRTYGLLCRWITEDFQERHVRQDELVAYVDENLRLIGETLCGLAGVRPAELDPIRLAAAPSLVEPVAAPGAGWTIEHFEPLRAVLDLLTGEPDVIASHVATWYNIAAELESMADDLAHFVDHDTPDWRGAEAAEHQRLMGYNVEAIRGLSAVSAALADTTQSTGLLVSQTRGIVRDLVIDLMALVVPPPSARPLAEGTFARWTCRIAVYAVALNIALTHLGDRLNG
ncbi:WXG100 family type VII secretion target [Kibdelosporangium phytohabitans]|uniref:ESX-1 secretion-associated protein EspA/EspE-like domain-containing protein n=1 Tax=Kibdelosporangium phytohabitans TaxID=860235 RepID=A0A0N9HZ54_9PSEU|nr:hypothetical protein [Kibdelosporangium phytohabitans]ALG10650.1 hypothetical protein AOZ06_30480 [Kibdelosporangium phytohabitans]MBE1461770.1 hypothetical protein [Kibdelosporangium phytohabitans]